MLSTFTVELATLAGEGNKHEHTRCNAVLPASDYNSNCILYVPKAFMNKLMITQKPSSGSVTLAYVGLPTHP